MPYLICYWDPVSKSQKERMSTPEEDAQRAADIAEAAVPKVPPMVTRQQALKSLFLFGITAAAIEAAINNAFPSPQKELALIEFQESLSFERNRPLVNALGPLLNLTPTQIDELFITASTL